MALPRNYHVDTRVFKSGKTNKFLNVASTYQLNDLISQIVLNTAPGMNQLPLLFNNAITDTYVNGQGTYIQWGGPLVQDTTVDGLDTYSLVMENFNGLTLDSSQVLTLACVNSLEVQTPLYGSRPDGAILRKTNIQGAVEYTPYSLPNSDGTLAQVLTTDGAGTVTFQTIPSNLIGADNGLSMSGSDVYLGGTLLQDTEVDGDGDTYSIGFTNMNEFVADGDVVSLSSITDLRLQTPGFNVSTPVLNSIVQLIDTLEGGVEYTPYSLPSTAPTEGDMLVATSTSALSFQSQKQSISIQLATGDIELSTISGTNAGEFRVPIGTNLDGFTLESVTTTPCVIGGAPVNVSYRLDHYGVGTPVVNGTVTSGVDTTVASSAVVLTSGDYFTFSFTAGSGVDLFGLVVVFDFVTS